MPIAMPSSFAHRAKDCTNAPSAGTASRASCSGDSIRYPLLHISGNSARSAPAAAALRQASSPFSLFSSAVAPGSSCSNATTNVSLISQFSFPQLTCAPAHLR